MKIAAADFIIAEDIPRFQEIGAMDSMNPVRLNSDIDYQNTLQSILRKEQLNTEYERWKDIIEAGAVVVNGRLAYLKVALAVLIGQVLH